MSPFLPHAISPSQSSLPLSPLVPLWLNVAQCGSTRRLAILARPGRSSPKWLNVAQHCATHGFEGGRGGRPPCSPQLLSHPTLPHSLPPAHRLLPLSTLRSSHPLSLPPVQRFFPPDLRGHPCVKNCGSSGLFVGAPKSLWWPQRGGAPQARPAARLGTPFCSHLLRYQPEKDSRSLSCRHNTLVLRTLQTDKRLLESFSPAKWRDVGQPCRRVWLPVLAEPSRFFNRPRPRPSSSFSTLR